MKYWYAVDADGQASLFKKKPVRREWIFSNGTYYDIPNLLNRSWLDEPIQVEISIKPVNKK